jgi:hypothetical protein
VKGDGVPAAIHPSKQIERESNPPKKRFATVGQAAVVPSVRSTRPPGFHFRHLMRHRRRRPSTRPTRCPLWAGCCCCCCRRCCCCDAVVTAVDDGNVSTGRAACQPVRLQTGMKKICSSTFGKSPTGRRNTSASRLSTMRHLGFNSLRSWCHGSRAVACSSLLHVRACVRGVNVCLCVCI